MSERDELAELFNRHGEYSTHEGLADIALAAGYRKPRTLTTVAELDALPVGSVLLDAQGWVGVILPTIDGQRCIRLAKSGDNLSALNSLVVQRMLPATVLHEPEAGK